VAILFRKLPHSACSKSLFAGECIWRRDARIGLVADRRRVGWRPLRQFWVTTRDARGDNGSTAFLPECNAREAQSYEINLE
jgi:hypothetical protein